MTQSASTSWAEVAFIAVVLAALLACEFGDKIIERAWPASHAEQSQ